MAASNTYAALRSDSATSPTTSPDHYWRPAASDRGYTLDCEEPLYTAGLASLVGYAIFTTLLGRYASATVVPWILLVPVVAMTAAWLVLGEQPTPAELVGGSVLVAGALVATRTAPSVPRIPADCCAVAAFEGRKGQQRSSQRGGSGGDHDQPEDDHVEHQPDHREHAAPLRPGGKAR